MLLINSLNGPYDSNTAEGLGANAAYQIIEIINKGKLKADENMRRFLKGEIGMDEVAKNEEFEMLAKAYIPYSSVDEETESINLKQGLAFTTAYIKAFDKDNDGAMTIQEAGALGSLIDAIDNSGKITPGKYLAWLIFQDCSSVLNGVLSPREIAVSMMLVKKDPSFVVEKLKQIYEGYKINELEKDFELPLPEASIN